MACEDTTCEWRQVLATSMHSKGGWHHSVGNYQMQRTDLEGWMPKCCNCTLAINPWGGRPRTGNSCIHSLPNPCDFGSWPPALPGFERLDSQAAVVDKTGVERLLQIEMSDQVQSHKGTLHGHFQTHETYGLWEVISLKFHVVQVSSCILMYRRHLAVWPSA